MSFPDRTGYGKMRGMTLPRLPRPSDLSRRSFLAASATGAAALSLGAAATSAPALVRTGRPRIPSGVAAGDVMPRSAVLWSRADRPGRMIVDLTRNGRFDQAVRIRGRRTDARLDFTSELSLSHLRPGQRYDYRIAFEGEDGLGQREYGSFRTPALDRRRAVSLVWTGDTAGQGWGINPDIGGMTAYTTMLETEPDFFLHSGDTIYADGPITESVTLPDGRVWHNVVTQEVTKVAETLDEFRGRYKYNLLDDNVRAFNAAVPIVAQWDDHETTNNWYPGEILTDERYTERRVDVLARRAHRAFSEYMPLSGSGNPRRERIHRTVRYGALLDVFCLDMRTFRDENPLPTEVAETPILGRAQARWLVDEMAASTATWKVVASDMPIGLLVPDGDRIEAVANGLPGVPQGRESEIAWVLRELKRRRVRNVVWLTADVHYCAAHHYDPARATLPDFDPFWELVAGPINAGTFGPGQLDPTFGPRVAFSKVADFPNQSPLDGNQFFGHVRIDPRTQVFEASLRDSFGAVLWSQDIEPVRRS